MLSFFTGLAAALSGYKTYIIAAAGVIVNGLHVVAPQLNIPVNEINTVLGFLGLGTLRAGVNKPTTPTA